jgi:hypothetical protein
VQVEFYKPSEKRRLAAWSAVVGRRTVVPGTVMAAGASLPHDLAQYVVEAASGYQNGFWGLVARGATFRSTGRRVTKPGRALIAAHRDELNGAERLAAVHLAQWHAGAHTSVTEPLTRALQQWNELGVGDRLVYEWPSATGTVRAAQAA